MYWIPRFNSEGIGYSNLAKMATPLKLKDKPMRTRRQSLGDGSGVAGSVAEDPDCCVISLEPQNFAKRSTEMVLADVDKTGNYGSPDRPTSQNGKLLTYGRGTNRRRSLETAMSSDGSRKAFCEQNVDTSIARRSLQNDGAKDPNVDVDMKILCEPNEETITGKTSLQRDERLDSNDKEDAEKTEPQKALKNDIDSKYMKETANPSIDVVELAFEDPDARTVNVAASKKKKRKSGGKRWTQRRKRKGINEKQDEPVPNDVADGNMDESPAEARCNKRGYECDAQSAEEFSDHDSEGAHEGQSSGRVISCRKSNKTSLDNYCVREIICPVTISKSTKNGKQNPLVFFKVMRSNGQEVVVDNEFLRSACPLLLLDFYEQHLNYSMT